MQVFHTLEELQKFQSKLKEQQHDLGFVATMGALHAGHMGLLHRAQAENQATIVSIFVNPTQFNNAEDLEKYPRRTDADLSYLEKEGATAVFIPSVAEVYGDEVKPDHLDLQGLDQGMEGDYRPGHFPGVVAVVRRLFEMIKPQRAYFGEKDFQQLQIVRLMARHYKLPVEVIGCETERYESGLAMSSRNYRLSAEGMQEASIIYREMIWARANYQDYKPDGLRKAIQDHFEASDLNLEYIDFADTESMEKVKDWQKHRAVRVFIGAFCEGVRLIDNLDLY